LLDESPVAKACANGMFNIPCDSEGNFDCKDPIDQLDKIVSKTLARTAVATTCLTFGFV
jgi:hypothetical protein